MVVDDRDCLSEFPLASEVHNTDEDLCNFSDDCLDSEDIPLDELAFSSELNKDDGSGYETFEEEEGTEGRSSEEEERNKEGQGNSSHACAYCFIDSPGCVVKCNQCEKWFCNSKKGMRSSHIINHLVLTHHNEISLHPDSDLGDAVLECYSCGCRNVFVLGFVSAKSEAVIVVLCRMPCAQVRNANWDTEQWQALIENRQLLSWVAEEPSSSDLANARKITLAQISELEAEWKHEEKELRFSNEQKDNPLHADPGDNTSDELEKDLEPILMTYNDTVQYKKSFIPLVDLEAVYDKKLMEANSLSSVNIQWSKLDKDYVVEFPQQPGMEWHYSKLSNGDDVRVQYKGSELLIWDHTGKLIRVPKTLNETFKVLIQDARTAPTHVTSGYRIEFIWKSSCYERMRTALKRFASPKKGCTSKHIRDIILGKHPVEEIENAIDIPKQLSVPNFVRLNASQEYAVSKVLTRPFSLIQGPPGTGKTVTSATIVYHLSKLMKHQILVCAPSNVAVDHLALKLQSMGLNVIRVNSKARSLVESSASHLSLGSLLKKIDPQLNKLLQDKESGKLSAKSEAAMLKLIREAEKKILKKADVICCTCVSSEHSALASRKFKTVLIDESTQSTEPDCLIPITKGAERVVLVGDHQQLGPVVSSSKAAEAGLQQSLFERLVALGHVPIRLTVQYRMNPHLAEFSSNMFYDGTLHNGVTEEQRSISNSNFPWPISGIPMMFWANYGREEISANGLSYLNRIEAMNVERIITKLFNDNVKPEQIGIVTPYAGQRAYIIQYMQMNGSLKKDWYMDVEVASVDGFQGREKDYIILTCVRSNDQNAIGFLRDHRRLNVGLTRAKYGLIILGNPTTLMKDKLWNHLLIHFREKGCLVEGTLDYLQLCTVQLRRPGRSTYQDAAGKKDAKNSNKYVSNSNQVPRFKISELDDQNLMPFGTEGLTDIFGASNDLSSFMVQNQWGNMPNPLPTSVLEDAVKKENYESKHSSKVGNITTSSSDKKQDNNPSDLNLYASSKAFLDSSLATGLQKLAISSVGNGSLHEKEPIDPRISIELFSKR